ncbi:MAG: phosphoenolpyruvate synthase [Candidatus Blackburnbacteria bacterium]|nr:phosphoenolpyruvate synthase [Candidatus Blackburnbacteria bacterium]
MPTLPKSFVLKFSEVSKEDIAKAGGKGGNLGEMASAGFPVPPGFIVSADAYKFFLKENDLEKRILELLKPTRRDGPKALERASREVKGLIERGKIPEEISSEVIKRYHKLGSVFHQVPVAIRSSATAEDLPQASFAGQQETFLNVRGEANVLDRVRRCWASLFTPRAIFYRKQNKIDSSKVAIAVIVQEMVQSEVSGVAFTVAPTGSDKQSLTSYKHKMVIEAIWGLGELIVQGAVTPDHYELERHSLKILDIKSVPQEEQLIKVGGKNVLRAVPSYRRKKQKLSEGKIVELAKILQRIHAHYYFPQDVEWAYKGGKFHIIQSRPITTLADRRSKVEDGSGKEKTEDGKSGEVILRGQGASPGIVTGVVKITETAKNLGKIRKGDILVTRMTSPDFVPVMKLASAIVTDEGGITSHAAIVSRELGLPCVVGTQTATRKLHDGQVVTVNGQDGTVVLGKPKTARSEQRTADSQKVELPERIKTATKIYVNLAEPERAADVAKLPVDGVGLLRAEFMIAEIGKHPRHLIAQGRGEEFVSKLAEGLTTFCQNFDPRPVVYRATDFKTNEYRNLDGGKSFEPEEPNPMLGFRGALRYMSDPEVFELELAAVRRVRENFKNLWIMLPFVRTPVELLEVKRIMAASGLIRSPSFRLWLMVELPVNVIMIEDFINVGIDGVSIGSNDLTMLISGTDRDNSEVAKVFDEQNPAVLWAMKKVILACRKHGITSSICGQAPSEYDSLVEYLVKLGITSISINPDSIGRVQGVIAETERKLVVGRRGYG